MALNPSNYTVALKVLFFEVLHKLFQDDGCDGCFLEHHSDDCANISGLEESRTENTNCSDVINVLIPIDQKLCSS